MKFGERNGLVPPRSPLSAEAMPPELRNALWNVLDDLIFSVDGFKWREGSRHGTYLPAFARHLWDKQFGDAVDSIPESVSRTMERIRYEYFECDYIKVYEFIEEAIKATPYDRRGLERSLNIALERELAAYRVLGGHIVPITSASELQSVADARQLPDRFAAVAAHLDAAQLLLSDRKSPDFRNSIKESISAVEAMAQVVTGKTKATLGEALRELENRHGLHPSLSKAFDKLYGYTSDADGIRHAMSEVPGLSLADARFFLVSCASFINYLKAKL